MTAHKKLVDSLQQLIEHAEDGDRIPTVRELMKTYAIGQSSVQEALRDLKARGLIRSHVGRGSFVAKPGTGIEQAGPNGAPAPLNSVLILSNVNMNERCMKVQSLVVEDMQARGAQVVQMSYSDTDHLLSILKGIPRFDAVIMQSHYETIPIRLLSALKDKTRALVIDGLTVSGVDIDRVGADWQEALGMALDHLVAIGRRKPALVTIDSSAQPMALTRRFFQRLGNWAGHEISTTVHLLDNIVHPTQNPEHALEEILNDIAASGADAIVFLGMSETAGIDTALTKSGLDVPNDMSVVILGHTDVPTEHLNKYTMAGVSHKEGAQYLIDSIVRRNARPDAAPQTHFLEAKLDIKASSAPLVSGCGGSALA